ncbi:hypothetical protein [uncultured Arcobacter sp.]|uniref:hypothetical protein n=1 Tax=uncultured Arcobacter sp. TaxID=165434 RepID=UPI0026292C18|nr:hypothetical protein [uncultured Arcobacter sp.]
MMTFQEAIEHANKWKYRLNQDNFVISAKPKGDCYPYEGIITMDGGNKLDITSEQFIDIVRILAK